MNSWDKILKDLEKARNKWKDKFNSRESLESIYSKDSGLLINYKFIMGQNNVSKALLKDDKYKICSIYKNKILKHDKTKYIEIGKYKTDCKETPSIAYISAWRNELGNWTKDLDVLIPAYKCKTNLKELDDLRNKWVEFANLHNPKLLIDTIYKTNAIYFSKFESNIGRESIINRYSYMLDKDFSISLKPEYKMKVNEKIVFETGIYTVKKNYSGVYVIIWEKQNNGEWQILLDFNF